MTWRRATSQLTAKLSCPSIDARVALGAEDAAVRMLAIRYTAGAAPAAAARTAAHLCRDEE